MEYDFDVLFFVFFFFVFCFLFWFGNQRFTSNTFKSKKVQRTFYSEASNILLSIPHDGTPLTGYRVLPGFANFEILKKSYTW